KIQAVFKSIDNWSASSLGMGWPLYVDQTIPPDRRTNPPATIPRKIPSALELFKNFGSFNDNSNYYQRRPHRRRSPECRHYGLTAITAQHTPSADGSATSMICSRQITTITRPPIMIT